MASEGVIRWVEAYRAAARARRAAVFRDSFPLTGTTTLLDLGSEDGSAIHAVLQGSAVRPDNVVIADIQRAALERGAATYGYTPAVLGEDGPLPFADRSFDIVFCSSVIEHVTVAKRESWAMRSGHRFRALSRERQRAFADEIRRVGRGYFVQTPYLYFPIESHTWLPGFAWQPRRLMVPALRLTNRVWIKQCGADWCLFDRGALAALFPDATIAEERSLGFVKSLMAIRPTEAAGASARAHSRPAPVAAEAEPAIVVS
jgi:SAM-dependent methyltransferase